MKTGVILLNWNNPTDTIRCINSLYNGTIVPDLFLIWDNSSSDDSCKRIKDLFPDVCLISNPTNIGFAEANNKAVTILLNENCDYIWVLNNDTVVEETCLEELLKLFNEEPEYQAVTGCITYMDRPETVWYAGGRFKHLINDAIHIGLDKPLGLVKTREGSIQFMTGCCMLIRAKLLREHLLFRSEFFAYCEDLEWSLRMNEAEVKLGYTPKAILQHKVSASVRKFQSFQGTLSPFQHRLQTRNRLWILGSSSLGPVRKTVAYIWLISRFLRYTFQNLLLGRLDKVSAILTGLREGLNP